MGENEGNGNCHNLDVDSHTFFSSFHATKC